MAKKTNVDGYKLAVAQFGSKAEMARALNVTRAAVDVWKSSGVPLKYIPALKKITGLRGRDMLPELVDLLD